LSWDIVDAMSTVKELVLSPAGTAAEPVVAGADEDGGADEDAAVVAGAVGVDEDDEQPAAMRAPAPARATQPSRVGALNVPWPGEREGRPNRCIAIATPPLG
jgi:hypothetical protein